MRILIDALSSQVQVQFQGVPPFPTAGRRFNTLLGAMYSGGTSLHSEIPHAEWQIGGQPQASRLGHCPGGQG